MGDRRSRVCWGLVRAAWGDGEASAAPSGGLSPWLSCLCSQPGPPLHWSQCPGGSGSGTLQVRLSGGRRPGVGLGVGVGAQAGGQSGATPPPGRTGRLELSPAPPQQGHPRPRPPLPPYSCPGVFLPMRIGPPPELPGCHWGSSSSSPPHPTTHVVILCLKYLSELLSSSPTACPGLGWATPFPWMAHWLSPLSCPPSPSDCQKHLSNTKT